MNKTTKRLLGLSFFLLVIVFLALYMRGIDFDQIRALSIDWSLLLLATIISLGFRYWGVFIWRTILEDLGSRELPPFRQLAAVYSKAWMGRYIPGTVTWIAGKIYLASSIGISKSRLTVASLLEAAVQIVAITTVSLFLVGFDPRTSVIAPQLKVLLVGSAVGLLISLHPAIFNRVIRFVFQKIRKKEAYSELATNKKTVVRSFLLYSAGSFLSGTSYFFMTQAIHGSTSWQLYFYLVGAYNLAGVIGMATPLVPSGLGVREGAQLILLNVVFPKEIALALTVFSRLWSVAVDLLFYASAQIFYKSRKPT
jgi:glycosyltransferase 2 family protein